jgi:hypothetical protein
MSSYTSRQAAWESVDFAARTLVDVLCELWPDREILSPHEQRIVDCAIAAFILWARLGLLRREESSGSSGLV